MTPLPLQPAAEVHACPQLREEFDVAFWRGENPDPDEYVREISDLAVARRCADALSQLKADNAQLRSDLVLEFRNQLETLGPTSDQSASPRICSIIADLLARHAPIENPKRNALLADFLRMALGILFQRGDSVRPDDFRGLVTGDDGQRALYHAFERFTRPSSWRFRQVGETPLDIGGQADIWLGRDDALDRPVILKCPRPEPPNQSVTKAQELRLDREARIMAGIDHPGVLSVFGVGRTRENRIFLAMEYLPGKTFSEEIATFHKGRSECNRQNPDFLRLMRYFQDACETVGAAHALIPPVLHRDLKPTNIMVNNTGATAVIDWGLAGRVGERDFNNNRNGTPEYMSPEQARDPADLLTPAADVYGLGATLYHLLTGKCPADWLGEVELRLVTDMAVLTANLRRAPAPAAASPSAASPGDGFSPWPDRIKSHVEKNLSRVGGAAVRETVNWARFLTAVRAHFPSPRAVAVNNVDPELDAICRRAMNYDPADRYPTATALAEAVNRWLRDEQPDKESSLGPVARWRMGMARWARRRPGRVVGVFIGAVFAAVVVIGLSWNIQERSARSRVEKLQERTYISLVELFELSEHGLPQHPNRNYRSNYLEKVAGINRALLDAEGPPLSFQPKRAEVYSRLARMYRSSGRPKQAAIVLQEAAAEFRPLAYANSGDLSATRGLAEIYHLLGEVNNESEQYRDAEKTYEAAIAEWIRTRGLSRSKDEVEGADLGLARTRGYCGDMYLRLYLRAGHEYYLDQARTSYLESHRIRESAWKAAGGTVLDLNVEPGLLLRRLLTQEQYAHSLNNLAWADWADVRRRGETTVKEEDRERVKSALQRHIEASRLQQELVDAVSRASVQAAGSLEGARLIVYKTDLGRTQVAVLGRLHLLLGDKNEADNAFAASYRFFNGMIEKDDQWQIEYIVYRARAATGRVAAACSLKDVCEEMKKKALDDYTLLENGGFDKASYRDLKDDIDRWIKPLK